MDTEEILQQLIKNVTILQEEVLALQESDESIALGLNVGWTLITATLVFSMQSGFAMLEAGSVREKNVVNILFKNMLDCCIGAVAWYFLGYAFAFGEGDASKFIGGTFWALEDVGDEPDNARWDHWFFQFTFCATAATIVSGAMAERTKIQAYFAYSAIISLWIYPPVAHWMWSTTGWMSPFRTGEKFWNGVGFQDYSGSGVVHMVGGICSLVGAAILGPREGRFPNKETKISHSALVFQLLGTFLLWVGWYGFNPGSTGCLNNGCHNFAARIAVTTTLAPSFSAVVGVGVGKLISGKWPLSAGINCILIGLVSVTAPCAVIDGWAAIVIGIVSAFIYLGGSALLIKLRIDDPVDASVVHFMGGLWGVLATGLFAKKEYVEEVYGLTDIDSYGGFMGGGGKQFGVQLFGAFIILLWTIGNSLVLFLLLKFTGNLRIDS